MKFHLFESARLDAAGSPNGATDNSCYIYIYIYNKYIYHNNLFFMLLEPLELGYGSNRDR